MNLSRSFILFKCGKIQRNTIATTNVSIGTMKLEMKTERGGERGKASLQENEEIGVIQRWREKNAGSNGGKFNIFYM